MAGAPEERSSAQGAVGLFGDRLASRVNTRSSQLLLGLDPDPGRLWPGAIEAAGGSGDPPAPPAARAALAVAVHCEMALDAVAEHCVGVKLQVACFERLGAAGWAALGEVATRARERGLIVIADAKRGDIDVTAAAYAQGFLGGTATPWGVVEGLDADAMTVNPLLGRDSLLPFVEQARQSGRGLFALVRTSNPGAADIQGLALEGGGTVSDRLAQIVCELGSAGIGQSGLADIGAVVGATAPDQLEALRAAMPHSVLLLPGVGPQGGRVEDLAAAFAPGAAAALVSVSRGIVNAYQRDGGDPAKAAAREAARLRDLTWEIAASGS